MNRRRRIRRFRDASVTLEFILVLPFLVVTLFAIAQFSVALIIRHAITQAAIVGAREAGKGEAIGQVAIAVDGVLDGSHDIDVADASGDAVSDSKVFIVLQAGAVTSTFGDATVPCTPPASPAADEVRVTVCMDLERQPLANWLYSFSPDYVDFSNRYLKVSSLVKVESP